MLDDAVATQGTVTQLIAAIRRVRREVPDGAALVARVATAHDYDQPGKPKIAWDDPAARAEMVDALVRDALAVLDAVGEPEPGSAAADAVGLLALVAGQDVELVDPDLDDEDGESGESCGPRWQIAQRVAADRVVSVVDPDSRHAHKTTSRRQDGFKAHLAVEPDTGLVTACELTAASGEHGSDANAGIRLLQADPALADADGPVQVLADSAYGSGDALAAISAAGHEPLVKPWPLRPAVPGGFTLDEFTVDEAAGTVTCPAGITRPISPSRQVAFGAACRGCPLRARCTTATRGRHLRVHQHDRLMREHRERAKDPAWQEIYRRHRPMVERSIAWLTAGGNRHLRYRGPTKNDAWLKHRIAALNLRRLLTLGLTTRAGAWVLA